MFDKAAFLHPCHIYRQGEDGTGKRVFLQLLRLHIFPRGGDKQRFHIVAAKADHCRAAYRQPVLFQLFALR